MLWRLTFEQYGRLLGRVEQSPAFLDSPVVQLHRRGAGEGCAITPVITEPRKAANALRNAVLEMERRLRLLASQGVRNIEQYNRKVRQL